MAVEFEKLQFKKNWNNASDFPTYEENEAQVRADLQALHDETKEFINEKLIPSIENLAVPGAGDMLAAIYDPNGKRKDVFQYAEDKAAAITRESLGAASDAAFQRHIDNTNNPHKVTADQVQVTENVVNTFEQTGNWSVDGILTQIGAMINSGATLYQWKKQRTELLQTSQTSVTYDFMNVGYRTIYYSDTITVGDNGRITLDNPKSVTVNGTNYLKPTGYFAEDATNQTTVYKTTDSTNKVNGYDPTNTYQITTLRNIETWSVGVNSSVVVSEDPSAHQDGEVDEEGFTYTALGSQSSVLTRMASGSYTGVGTYGEANSNVLTFPFIPQIVLVQGVGIGALLMWVDGASQYRLATSSVYWMGGVTVEDRIFKWYGTSADNQLNKSGTEYNWIAIG